MVNYPLKKTMMCYMWWVFFEGWTIWCRKEKRPLIEKENQIATSTSLVSNDKNPNCLTEHQYWGLNPCEFSMTIVISSI